MYLRLIISWTLQYFYRVALHASAVNAIYNSYCVSLSVRHDNRRTFCQTFFTERQSV